MALGNVEDIVGISRYIGFCSKKISKYIVDNELIEVFSEHGTTNLQTYFVKPSKFNNIEIVELDALTPPKLSRIMGHNS